MRGHRELRGGIDQAEQVAEGPLGRMGAVLDHLGKIDNPWEAIIIGLPIWLGRLVEPHIFEGPHIRRGVHFVDEHVHARSLMDAMVFGLGVARVDHRQPIPLQLVTYGAFPGVDYWKVGDFHAGVGVAIGNVVSFHFPVLFPVQFDGDYGIPIVGRVVRYGPGIVWQSPAFPGGRFIAFITGGYEALAFGVPAAGFPKILAKGFDTIVVEAAWGSRAFYPGWAASKDEQGTFTVRHGSEAVDVDQIADVVAVQMGQKDLVHPAQRNPHGVVIGAHAGAAVEHELVRLTHGISYLHEDAHHLLGPAKLVRDVRAHERDPHFIGFGRNVGFRFTFIRFPFFRIPLSQVIEIGILLCISIFKGGVFTLPSGASGRRVAFTFVNRLRLFACESAHGAAHGNAPDGHPPKANPDFFNTSRRVIPLHVFLSDVLMNFSFQFINYLSFIQSKFHKISVLTTFFILVLIATDYLLYITIGDIDRD
jgi:hypothetical protein